MKRFKVILMGAGSRGRAYTDIMAHYSDRFEVVGVADPVKERREYIREKHNISPDKCFERWEEMLSIPKFADIAIIATLDQDHVGPAVKAAELGYDMLLEKPIAPTAEDCAKIKKAADANGVKAVVCHVLRYTPMYSGLKKLLDDGVIGEIMSVDHIEAVGNTHQAHSFVRGNWRTTKETSCMLLQKSCHDLDLIQWLTGKECTRIQSFGSLTHFTKENAPDGAPDRCTDNCPYNEECYYSAYKHYYNEGATIGSKRAVTKMPEPTDEQILKALAEGPYGRCVYKCDNDVVDHQTVNMEFADSMTVTFSMNAFNEGGRRTRIMGTKGEINAYENQAHIYSFADRKTTTVQLAPEGLGETIESGHGGGDGGIVNALYDYLAGIRKATEVSELDISFKNHLLVFAAEESRKNGTVVDMKEFTENLLK